MNLNKCDDLTIQIDTFNKLVEVNLILRNINKGDFNYLYIKSKLLKSEQSSQKSLLNLHNLIPVEIKTMDRVTPVSFLLIINLRFTYLFT